ncbi:MAG: DUF4837 family protein [Prevotellaceae bacterium]|jgi:hypothetical protein|nr:DUF4837 family protein [Prevotellaceae bacterium]
MRTVIVFILVALLVASCDDNVKIPKPGATGKAGEVLVIIDNAYWNSDPCDTIREMFRASYPMLPQNESKFNLIQVGNSSFVTVMQKHRNILLISISSDFTEPKITVTRDLWAEPQVVVNALGADIASVASMLGRRRNHVLNVFEQTEIERQSANAMEYSDKAIRDTIRELAGINMHIPSGYYLMRRDPDFIWLESRTNHNSMGLFIYTYPFVDSETFTVDYLVNKRNTVMKQKVPGSRDSSWMTTTDFLTPQLEIKQHKGLQYGELRGLWELVNDYMGGPFISRSYVDRKRNRIITVEGYVYAPRTGKRDLIRRAAGIINTFSLDSIANQNFAQG